MRAPALERYLRRARAHARALPAVLSSTSRSAAARRRARPGRPRPATARSTKLVLGLRLAAPGGEIELPALPASAAGPGSAPAAGRLGGDARRDQRAARCACARRPRERHLRGRLLRGLRGRRARRCARSRASTRCRTWRACPTSARRACRWRSPAAAGSRAGSGAPTWACAATRGGCLAILGFEGDAEERREPAHARARADARARRRCARRALARARRGCRGASRRRTCATSCSRTA